MKKLTCCLITAIAAQLITLTGFAQTAIALKPAPAHVVIDGDIKEWGDSLNYFNDATRLFYTLANDKDNLYLVVKTNDPATQAKILSSGIAFGIDTKGRKKDTYSITFPVQEQYGLNTQGGSDKKLEAHLTKLRRMKVDGFKDVDNDLITLQNTYGFNTAINYDEKGFLVYEEVIPLKLFHADDLMAKEWAFNIKVNSPQKTAKADDDEDDDVHSSQMGRSGRGGGGGGGGGRGGRGGGGGGGRGGHSRTGDAGDTDPGGSSVKSADFWGKFVLAKP
ncbi:MAG TPA: hypothetical protein VL490_02085 [Mucilaginibacter sp.]|jgi:uncharacterized membrane protein YgcG|nr:hypothetical protein [Mucilaginibacter sp.]